MSFKLVHQLTSVLGDALPAPPMIPGTNQELPPIWQILVSGLLLSFAVFLTAKTLIRRQRSGIVIILVLLLLLTCLAATIIAARYVSSENSAYQKQIQNRRGGGVRLPR